MKRKDLFSHLISIVLFLMLFVTLKTYALDYTITFTGTGASTTVSSVIVQNLTQGTIVTVPTGNDLNLSDAPNAVELLNEDDETIRIYPDAVEGKFTVSFFAKQAGSTQLNAFSIDGRKIAGITENLQIGINSFQLSLPKGSFVIQVVGNGYAYTGKMINQTGTVRKPEISHNGTVKPTTYNPQKSKKSAPSITTMTYITGDQLLYKGISGNYNTIVTDVPTSSKTINFDFVTCTDADGNNYTTVTIGTQTWMVENLKTTKYSDGTAIPMVTDNSAWFNLSTPAYCWYNNDEATNKNTYGALYNRSAVNTSKLAPAGWHVPTDTEWTTLTTYLGGESVAGGKLKEIGTDNWSSPNIGATNVSGFSALPGGGRGDSGGRFFRIGNYGAWWSTTEYDTSNPWIRVLDNYSSSLSRCTNNLYGYGTNGFSVRCVKDDVSSIDIQKVNIPAGTFTMGSPENELDRDPDETQHTVTISSFKMSKYEITNDQFANFLNKKGVGSDGVSTITGANQAQVLIYESFGSFDWGLHYINGKWIPVTGYEDYPVMAVTWYGACEFATFVGGKIPTEAQWEYACRAGTTTPFNTGNCLTNLQANYKWSTKYGTCYNSITDYPGTTQIVGSYPANAFGLYDMHGNVWEWCSEYPSCEETNPNDPLITSNPVLRGGSWIRTAKNCRSAYRYYSGPPYNLHVGIRIVFKP